MNTLMRLITAFVATLVLSACSGNSPTAPTPQPTPNPVPVPVPAPVPSLSGTVTATNGKQPLGGVTVSAGGLSTVTDASGGFRLAVASGASVSLSGAGLVPRQTRLGPSLEMFGPGFDLGFFRQIARNGFEQPTILQPIRRLTSAPNVYMRTVTDDGRTVNAETLAQVSALLSDAAMIWSGGSFGLASIASGLETREGQAGWITVRWLATDAAAAGVCGQAMIGAPSGSVLLRYDDQRCRCAGSTKVYPTLVRHELGHAFGFYHTDSVNDVMNGGGNRPCDLQPSAREREYARYVYSRVIGNRDPDIDP